MLRKKNIKEKSRPMRITMAQWCDNIELLRNSPELFKIPTALCEHIKISEHTEELKNFFFIKETVLALDISLETNLGMPFITRSIKLTDDLTSEDMLIEMENIIKDLTDASGFDENRLSDGSWIEEESLLDSYKNTISKYGIN